MRTNYLINARPLLNIIIPCTVIRGKNEFGKQINKCARVVQRRIKFIIMTAAVGRTFFMHYILNLILYKNQIKSIYLCVYKSCLLKSATVHEHIISANSMHNITWFFFFGFSCHLNIISTLNLIIEYKVDFYFHRTSSVIITVDLTHRVSGYIHTVRK